MKVKMPLLASTCNFSQINTDIESFRFQGFLESTGGKPESCESSSRSLRWRLGITMRCPAV
jgi:hypothetical protein